MLVRPESSEDLEGVVCSARGPVVVAFLDPGCPVSRSYAPVFRAVAEASPDGVFVEAWLDRVAGYAERLGIAYAPVTVVFHECRPLVGLPGAATMEDLRLLLERVVPELLQGKGRGAGGGPG